MGLMSRGLENSARLDRLPAILMLQCQLKYDVSFDSISTVRRRISLPSRALCCCVSLDRVRRESPHSRASFRGTIILSVFLVDIRVLIFTPPTNLMMTVDPCKVEEQQQDRAEVLVAKRMRTFEYMTRPGGSETPADQTAAQQCRQ